MADLTQYAPTDDQVLNDGGGFGPLPPNWYNVYIDGVPELNDTKKRADAIAAGDPNPPKGLKLEPVYKVMGGDYNGRIIWGSINVDNDSQKCVAMGARELGELGVAAGLPGKPDSTEQLANARLMIRVKIKDGGKYNEVTGYKPAGQQAPAAAPTAIQPQPAATPPASTGPMPWNTPEVEAGKFDDAATIDDDNIPM